MIPADYVPTAEQLGDLIRRHADAYHPGGWADVQVVMRLNDHSLRGFHLCRPSAEIASEGPTDWLDEVVTDEAKKDPDWREKAKTCRGAIYGATSPGGRATSVPQQTTAPETGTVPEDKVARSLRKSQDDFLHELARRMEQAAEDLRFVQRLRAAEDRVRSIGSSPSPAASTPSFR